MATFSPNTAAADEVAAGGSSATFPTLLMTAGAPGLYQYQYSANVATWIAQGATPTASAGPGSMYVPAGAIVTLDGALGAKCAVINDGSAGKASLTPMLRTC